MKFVTMTPVVRMSPYSRERREPFSLMEHQFENRLGDCFHDDMMLASPWSYPKIKYHPHQWERKNAIKKKSAEPETWSHKLSLPDIFELKHVKTEVKEQKVLVVTAVLSQRDENSEDKIEARRTIDLPENVKSDTIKVIKMRGTFFVTGEMKREELQHTDEDTDKFVDVHADPKPLELSFNLGSLDPEHVSVKLHGDKLVVSGRQVEEGEGRYSSQEFYRVVTLPQHVNAEELKSVVSDDGQLRVTAPVKLELTKSKDIPVEMKKPEDKEEMRKSEDKGEKEEEKTSDMEDKCEQ